MLSVEFRRCLWSDCDVTLRVYDCDVTVMSLRVYDAVSRV